MDKNKLQQNFGVTNDGRNVELYRIGDGVASMEIITYGAIVRSLKVPGKRGKPIDIILGCDSVQDYENDTCYIGCMIGRVANRIKNGRFYLDNQLYQLPVNSGPNHLHGGPEGFNTKVWDVISSDEVSVTLRHESVDGEQGYPGTLDSRVTYSLTPHGSKYRFSIETNAVAVERSTPCNLTNHAYFNLSGDAEPTVHGHEISIASTHYLPTDENNLATGVVQSVEETPYNLRSKVNVGLRIDELLSLGKPAFDAYYCLENKGKNIEPCVELRSEATGIRLRAFTNHPGVQFYSGHYLLHEKGKNSRRYDKYGGLCLEFQGYPDAVNQKHFPSIILKPGETYAYSTIFEIDTV